MKKHSIIMRIFRKRAAFTAVIAVAVVFMALLLNTEAEAAGYNADSACSIDASTSDMRSFSSTIYDASYNKDSWVFHDTKGGDAYKPKAGDIIVYGQYPDGVTYWEGSELGIKHVEICVENYDPATGNYGVIGGNTGESTTDPYYLGSKVECATLNFNDYYQAPYGEVFIYNIWEVKRNDVSESIVYSAGRELKEFEGNPEKYRNKIFALQGKRNWCDMFVAYVLQTTEKLPKGKINILKSPAEEELSGNNKVYSLEGAVYGIFTDKECTQKACELITDANGKTETAELPCGTYYAKEISPSSGFLIDENVYEIKLEKDNTVTINSKEPPLVYKGGLKIKKICGCDKPDCNKNLSGAEFKVSCFDNTEGKTGGEPFKEWTVRVEYNEESGEYAAVLEDELPKGTYLIEETKVPEGFIEGQFKIRAEADTEKIVENTGYIFVIKEEGEELCPEYGNVFVVENVPVPEEPETEEAETEEKITEETPEETKPPEESRTERPETFNNPKTGEEGAPYSTFVIIGFAALVLGTVSFALYKKKD